MKKKISVIILLIFHIYNLEARSLTEGSLDDFEVEDKKVNTKQSKTREFLDKNFSGYIGASHLKSENNRSSAILNLQLEDKKKWGNYVISTEAYHSEIGLFSACKILFL